MKIHTQKSAVIKSFWNCYGVQNLDTKADGVSVTREGFVYRQHNFIDNSVN